MEFSESQPIYKQIVDYCHRCIMSGEWREWERIPSTKDLSVALGVNNRTVLKAFDELNESEVIFQKRGLGYFVSSSAPERIRALMRAEFMTKTLPKMIETMRSLGITREELLRAFDTHPHQ